MAVNRVEVTAEAAGVIDVLRALHGPLMFHQSGGCCDGSSPMCFAVGQYRVGSRDVCLGRIQGCYFYMAPEQFEYWQNTQLTVDVTPGRGASFSLEIPLGLRFVVKSRVFTDGEQADLAPVTIGAATGA